MIDPYIHLEKDFYDFKLIFNLKDNFTEKELFEAYKNSNKTEIEWLGLKILKDDFYKEVYYHLKSITKLYEAGFFVDEIPIEEYLKQEEYFDINFLTTNFSKISKNFIELNNKKNVVLLTTGGFSPLHDGHISMMENAYNFLSEKGFNVLGGYFAPSHDKYVSNKYNGKAALNIEKRINIIEKKLESHPYLLCDRWEGLYNKYEVNYTETIKRLKAYLNQHIPTKNGIEICLVFGGDNIGFCNTFIYKGMGVCVKRPNYKNEINHNSKNVFIINNKFNDNISSSMIRESLNKDKNIKKEINYGIRNDLKLSISNEIDNNLINQFYENFKNILEINLSKSFNVNFIHIDAEKQISSAKKIIDRQNLKTISLDTHLKGDFNLEISREFNLSDIQNSSINMTERPFFKSIKDQISIIPSDNYLLIEDDIITGNSINKLKSLLPSDININDMLILSSLYNKELFDIIDFRDFIIGSNQGGLVVNLDGKNIRVPYFLPYVSPNSRVSIPTGRQLLFSEKCWELNLNFYNLLNTDLKLKDLSKDFIFLMNYVGFSKYDKIEDICNWHIQKLSLHKEMYNGKCSY